jgi:hypothetical protein
MKSFVILMLLILVAGFAPVNLAHSEDEVDPNAPAPETTSAPLPDDASQPAPASSQDLLGFVLDEQITDQQNVLSEGHKQIAKEIDTLKEQQGITIWIVIEASLGSDSDIFDISNWASKTAKVSNFGDHDVLLVIDTSKHNVASWLSADSVIVNKSSLSAIQSSLIPYLNEMKWSEAVLKFISMTKEKAQTSNSVFPYIFGILLLFILVTFLSYAALNRKSASNEQGFFEKMRNNKKQKEALENLELIQSVATIPGAITASVIDDAISTASVDQASNIVNSTAPVLTPRLQNQSLSDPPLLNNDYRQTGPVLKQPRIDKDPIIENFEDHVPVNDAFTLNVPTYSAPVEQTNPSKANLLDKYGIRSSKFSTPAAPAPQPISPAAPQPSGDPDIYNKLNVYVPKFDNLQNPNISTAGSLDKKLYSDYYTRSASRDIYGSFYHSDEAMKHDEQINAQRREANTYQTQSLTNQYVPKSDTKGQDKKDAMTKYYEQKKKGTFRSRFDF